MSRTASSKAVLRRRIASRPENGVGAVPSNRRSRSKQKSGVYSRLIHSLEQEALHHSSLVDLSTATDQIRCKNAWSKFNAHRWSVLNARQHLILEVAHILFNHLHFHVISFQSILRTDLVSTHVFSRQSKRLALAIWVSSPPPSPLAC